ncbi:MAG: glycoside hydrolase family 3 protein [Oscillospiraceae bacterium]|nr:glycoside hydrolase family 3 protein [Oscillospiraceae bacterium]
MIDLKANPFHLSDEDIRWVEETRDAMTTEQKAGQIFCALGIGDDEGMLRGMIDGIGIGGIMYRPGPKAVVQNTHRKIQSMAKIPLLLAANTEAGGSGLSFEGTGFGAPLAVAATGDPETAYRMGYVACKEGAAMGLNWSFAPIVDIDREFHNPITNTRTFGSDPETVLRCASRYLDAADECNVAVSIKHFPGDGVDERDQHILTSVNSLSCEEWMATYGHIYKALIDKGAKTVMVGHIAQPAWAKRLNPAISKKDALCPASLSKEILTGLLRGELGFNGLVSTDSSAMVGFTAAMPRSRAVPTAIEAGCDMVLFNKDIREDYGYVLQGLENGLLSMERLNDAVTRILATKASLGLHRKQKDGTLVPGPEALEEVGCEKHRAWSLECADKAVTLVHDRQNLLPISPKKFRRVYLNVIQKSLDPEDPTVLTWKKLFEDEGFEVTVRDRRVSIEPSDFDTPELSPEKAALMAELYRGVEDMKKSYDLYVYIANMQNASNNTTLRLNWNVCFGLGDDAPWLCAEIPVMMISTGYPYHLFDAPMIDTFINAYSNEPQYKSAVMDKIMGRSAFKGVSPVDPYCGKDYLKY